MAKITVKDFEQKNQFYLVGDMLSLGAQYEMSVLEKKLDKYNLPYYSARLNKEINDKATASNKNLAERIYIKDITEIIKSKYIIFNLNQNAIGSLTEIGGIGMWNLMMSKSYKYV